MDESKRLHSKAVRSFFDVPLAEGYLERSTRCSVAPPNRTELAIAIQRGYKESMLCTWGRNVSEVHIEECAGSQIIVQLEGKKKWSIWPPGEKPTLRTTPPQWVVITEEGHSVFLPGGSNRQTHARSPTHTDPRAHAHARCTTGTQATEHNLHCQYMRVQALAHGGDTEQRKCNYWRDLVRALEKRCCLL